MQQTLDYASLSTLFVLHICTTSIGRDANSIVVKCNRQATGKNSQKEIGRLFLKSFPPFKLKQANEKQTAFKVNASKVWA